MAKVLVAPDKFKGSLDAQQVAGGVIRGMRAVDPSVDSVAVPVAEGGEGTLSAALAAGFAHVPVVAGGPTGYPVHTAYARRGRLAERSLSSTCRQSRAAAPSVPHPLVMV